MSSRRRLGIQILTVLILGAAVQLTPRTAEARSPLVCYDSCSEALFDQTCNPPLFPQCAVDTWDCPPWAPYVGYCGADS